MRAHAFLAAASVAALSLGATSLVLAQQAKDRARPPASTPAGETVRYITSFGEMMGDLASDAVWRETRTGKAVTAVTLDVCHSVAETSNRKDRFVATLTPEGGKLVGRTTSEQDKAPVAVSFSRKQDGDVISLDGTITRGDKTVKVAIADLRDMSETEFREQQRTPDDIQTAPARWTEATPITVAARFQRDAFAEVISRLRGEPVRVDYASLVATCDDLRSGTQVVRLEASPAKAADVVATLTRTPGVITAGWTGGAYAIDHGVRLPAGPWRGSGGAESEALVAKLAAILAPVVGATHTATERDPITREVTLKFTRPDRTVRGLDLVERLEITLLVAPEKPGDTDHLVVWVGESSIEPADESSGPRLTLSSGYRGDDEDASAVELDALLAAIAKAMDGRVGDGETNDWK